jgi:putative holliday junction resolvase
MTEINPSSPQNNGKNALPAPLPRGRWLGLDVGEKRVGVAVSDSMGLVATGVGTAARAQEIDWADWKQRGIVAVVVGLPLNMDGSSGPSASRAHSVADWIMKEQGLPVRLWDERLTSRQAETSFFEQRTGRQTRASKKDSVGKVDVAAAVLILQGALDAAGVA